jgi:ubiquinone/menaquinone biosynthesis C-methylase UbiE
MKDLFSNHADQYAAFRPKYPKALFQFLSSISPDKHAVWDVGTGNGQAAIALAEYFESVFATDISDNQLRHAPQNEKVRYALESAERTSLKDNSIDLITVGQAFHWFEESSFFTEANRVLKPNGIIALWGYGLFEIKGEKNLVIQNFYKEIVGSYWDIERRKVDEKYQQSAFPFNEISVPYFQMTYQWSPEQLFGYINTWSAVNKFAAINGFNPTDDLIDRMELTEKNIEVNFPLFFRIGRK